MNFIMSYDRERDLIGFRLHKQEDSNTVTVRAMRVYNQPRTVVNIWSEADIWNYAWIFPMDTVVHYCTPCYNTFQALVVFTGTLQGL